MSGARLGGAALLALVAAAIGCDDRAYCFDCGEGAGGSGATVGSTGGAAGDGGAGVTVANGVTVGSGQGGDDCDADTQTDVENCGACDHRCDLLGAVAACEAGECVVESCVPGSYDLDPAVPGCEYACVVPEPGPEVCDGLDNDCDGLVDGDDDDLSPPPGLCNTEPGTPCEATEVVCDPGEGWRCVYPAAVEAVEGILREEEGLCDGLDGDCDGEVDEFFLALGDVCDDGALGACRDFGLVKCDPGNPLTTFCDLSEPPDAAAAEPEACNAVDDDCNGLVDDALPAEAFARIDVSGVWVDAFEASRPDATAADPGIREAVACSSPGVLPWTGGGYAEAEAACAARGAGFRLCTAAELEAACAGVDGRDYPYGDAFEPMTCNGVERGEGQPVPTGGLAACSSADGLFDLSGNVAEWTSTQTNAAAAPDRIFQLHGGSYLAPELGLACSIELAPRALEVTLLPSIGFRCCQDQP
jgi:hypothetical protein